MISATPALENLRLRYRADFTTHAYRMEAWLAFLRSLTQGIELLMLVSAFLIYYLTDCMLQAYKFHSAVNIVS